MASDLETHNVINMATSRQRQTASLPIRTTLNNRNVPDSQARATSSFFFIVISSSSWSYHNLLCVRISNKIEMALSVLSNEERVKRTRRRANNSIYKWERPSPRRILAGIRAMRTEPTDHLSGRVCARWTGRTGFRLSGTYCIREGKGGNQGSQPANPTLVHHLNLGTTLTTSRLTIAR